MRRQLIAALSGLAIFTLALYIAPRSVVTARLVRDNEQQVVTRSVELISVGLDSRIENGTPIDPAALDQLVRPEEELTLELADGDVMVAGSVPDDEATYAARRELIDGSQLTLRRSSDAIREQVIRGMAPVVALASLAVVIAVLAAVLLSRRLSAPFQALADYAEELSEESHAGAPRSGMAEADDIAAALDRTTERVAGLLRSEREFSANASHQLRTPLAALRLRLEDLAGWDEAGQEVRDELRAALGEVDRLSATIRDLLELARLGGIGTWSDVDIIKTVRNSVERWEPMFSNSERRLHLTDPAGRVVAPTSARGLKQVLDVLLENALVHGQGAVEISVHETPDAVVLCVGDHGHFDPSATTGVFDRTFRSTHRTGSGIGLSLAQTIAETAGARIQLASTDPTVFEVRLPVADRAPAPAG